MHLNTLTFKEAIDYIHNLRIQLDRIINTPYPGDGDWDEKLIDSRNWLGVMLDVAGEDKTSDVWFKYPEFKDELSALESFYAEITKTYKECQSTAFGVSPKDIKQEDGQTFQTGYLRAIFYMIEAAMRIETRIQELQNDKS